MIMKSRIVCIISILLLTAVFMSGCVSTPDCITEVSGISKYGHAVLDTTPENLLASGITLGDTVTVSVGDFTQDIPYLDGFYVKSGDYLLRCTSDNSIEICINYGNIAEKHGIEIGDAVSLTLREKGGSLFLLEIAGGQYSSNREDFAGDEIFANFRMVTLGGIAENTLYRSASPINNDAGRASVSNMLAEKAKISSAVNLADSAEDILHHTEKPDFSSEYYLSLFEDGKVLTSPLLNDFTSEEYISGVVAALTFLSENEPPYLVHCNEGKDRAGFTVALIGALMGASVDEISNDYMVSYENYYGITKEDEKKYTYVEEGNIQVILKSIAGLAEDESFDSINLQKAAEEFVLSHGMSKESLSNLRMKLSGNEKL